MRKILGLVFVLALFAATAPVAAGDPPVDTYWGPFPSNIITAVDLEAGVVTVGDTECAFAKRVWHPDGTAHETMKCALTGDFWTVDIATGDWSPCPECTAPKRAWVDRAAPPCIYFSDYIYWTTGGFELADRYRATVTPSGQVSATLHYEGGCGSG